MRNIFINTILDEAKKNKKLFIVSGDAGLGVFDNYKEDCSDQFLNLGVAEQNAASFCAGMALTGHKVYLYNIIPFLLYRCYEQVRNDICYQELPVVLVGIGSGITYAPQGMTHYSIEDIGLAQTLPNLTVFSPIDPIEAKAAAEYSLISKTPVYVRLPKRGEPCFHQKAVKDITLPQVISEGREIALLFHGSIGIEVMEAKRKLEKKKIDPLLISVPMVQPLPFIKLNNLLKNVKQVVCIEEHYSDCGLSSILTREYLKHLPKWKLHSLGIHSHFIHTILKTEAMRHSFGISSQAIADYVERLVSKGGG